MDDLHGEKVDLEDALRAAAEQGLVLGLIGAGIVFLLIADRLCEDAYAWKPSLEAWLLILSGSFAVGFIAAFCWTLWKCYFPRPEKEGKATNVKHEG